MEPHLTALNPRPEATTPVGRLEEHEQRITAIEERLELEAGLRASVDRDLGDMAQTLRGQQSAIQALAITQSQHNEKLDRFEEKLGRQLDRLEEKLGRRLDRHEKKLERQEEFLTTAHGKLDRILTMLGSAGR